MNAIIINNEIKYDKDALSLADMGYEIGEKVHLSVCQLSGEMYLTVKQDLVIDGIVAVYAGEEICVSDDEVEMMA
ncbi:hypothetical protein Sd1_gp65 [Shigella phage Sd1]|uniref:Uncharacterized protein n=1 Tax=Shigella phage Sd1 TaxID=2024313 RepID=A0A291AYQ3_9CAUD|nr:hypothetical protein HOR98_gp63 [Shigella phage Sd1]ATE86131.1 hypothetical protein Sd1_gp65 [Shigella phage Sd1]